MKIKLSIFAGVFFCILASADFKILKNASEFKQLIQNSTVPVLVQFSAYWCGPCQALKTTFIEVADEYTDEQVILSYVDAYENPELKSYLQGGYPTTRTFWQGKLASQKFVGSEDIDFVRSFIDSVIADPSQSSDQNHCLP